MEEAIQGVGLMVPSVICKGKQKRKGLPAHVMRIPGPPIEKCLLLSQQMNWKGDWSAALETYNHFITIHVYVHFWTVSMTHNQRTRLVCLG
jgi:hypothetical protein